MIKLMRHNTNAGTDCELSATTFRTRKNAEAWLKQISSFKRIDVNRWDNGHGDEIYIEEVQK